MVSVSKSVFNFQLDLYVSTLTFSRARKDVVFLRDERDDGSLLLVRSFGVAVIINDEKRVNVHE